jgi:hypothetical protein
VQQVSDLRLVSRNGEIPEAKGATVNLTKNIAEMASPVSSAQGASLRYGSVGWELESSASSGGSWTLVGLHLFHTLDSPHGSGLASPRAVVQTLPTAGEVRANPQKAARQSRRCTNAIKFYNDPQ